MSTRPRDLRIALVQSDLIASQPQANLDRFVSIIEQQHTEADLFVLPESMTTGFALGATEAAEPMQGESLMRLQSLADRLGVGIAGTLFVREAEGVYNRFFLIDGGQPLQTQDKRHLFSMAGEARRVRAAESRKLLNFRGWRILPIVCYDLRFPVWCRCVDNEYDLILAVANWPEARAEVWRTLMRARAMENLAWLVGCNRVGTDADGLIHSGDSAIINPRGAVVASCRPHTEEVVIAQIDYESMERLREKFPVWRDADRFDLHL